MRDPEAAWKGRTPTERAAVDLALCGVALTLAPAVGTAVGAVLAVGCTAVIVWATLAQPSPPDLLDVEAEDPRDGPPSP